LILPVALLLVPNVEWAIDKMSARVSSKLDLKPILRPIGQKDLGSFNPPNRLTMSLGVYTLHMGDYHGLPVVPRKAAAEV
jgi:hypothetical protein